MTQRISREALPDEALDRARHALLAHITSLGGLSHRFTKTGKGDAAHQIDLDEKALGNVLAILLYEQKQRRWDDHELTV